MATASDDRTARGWSADRKGEPVVLRGHEDWLTSAAWSPDGARVLTTSLDHTARVWLACEFQELLVFKGHGGPVYSASWSPGARIVTGSEDGTVQVWDAASGAVVASHDRGSPPGGHLEPRRRPEQPSRRGGAASTCGAATGGTAAVGASLSCSTHRRRCLALTFLDGGKRLFTVAADNTTRTFTIDVAELRLGLL